MLVKSLTSEIPSTFSPFLRIQISYHQPTTIFFQNYKEGKTNEGWNNGGGLSFEFVKFPKRYV